MNSCDSKAHAFEKNICPSFGFLQLYELYQKKKHLHMPDFFFPFQKSNRMFCTVKGNVGKCARNENRSVIQTPNSQPNPPNLRPLFPAWACLAGRVALRVHSSLKAKPSVYRYIKKEMGKSKGSTSMIFFTSAEAQLAAFCWT